MSTPNFGFDGARNEQEIKRWAAGVAAKAERYQDMQRQVAAITASATSDEGHVRVTVSASGEVTDLAFGERVQHIPPAELAALILATMRRAQARITDQVAEVMRETVGEDRETVDAVVSSYRSRFPEQETPPSEREQRRRVHDDGDEENGSIFD